MCYSYTQGRGRNRQKNFLLLAKLFVESASDPTVCGSKVLLTYDSYRAHISLPVLDLFAVNINIVYDLPAHTSGKTQPLDANAFGVFKIALNNGVSTTVQPTHGAQGDYIRLLRYDMH